MEQLITYVHFILLHRLHDSIFHIRSHLCTYSANDAPHAKY